MFHISYLSIVVALAPVLLSNRGSQMRRLDPFCCLLHLNLLLCPSVVQPVLVCIVKQRIRFSKLIGGEKFKIERVVTGLNDIFH